MMSVVVSQLDDDMRGDLSEVVSLSRIVLLRGSDVRYQMNLRTRLGNKDARVLTSEFAIRIVTVSNLRFCIVDRVFDVIRSQMCELESNRTIVFFPVDTSLDSCRIAQLALCNLQLIVGSIRRNASKSVLAVLSAIICSRSVERAAFVLDLVSA
ncbi:hypothetical protein Tco_0802979 [Tanacetum coccineum]|uniref:Uncharacterized protein n=1 Tax=Tanacetum coccineum TaxID=301880 RepID=A0ABQ5A2T2_9ASTR